MRNKAFLKIVILTALLTAPFFVFILSPLEGFAQTEQLTVEALQKQIQQLLNQIQDLQKKVDNLESELGVQETAPVADAAASAVSPSSLPIFLRSLSLGSRGDDVRELQKYLAQDKAIYPDGLITGYFGPLTQQAIQKFQKKYEIVSSGTPETTGYGIIGPKTIAKFKEFVEQGSAATPAIPATPAVPGVIPAIPVTSAVPIVSSSLSTTTPPVTIVPPVTPPVAISSTTTPPTVTPPIVESPISPTTVSNQAVPAWVRLFGSSNSYGITIDGLNNIYIVGDASSMLDGQINSGGDDAFIAKYDGDGNKVWTRLAGSVYGDYFKSAAVDNSNNIYAVGLTYKSVDGQTHFGNTDALIIKYDASGSKLWTRQFGASLNDQLYGASIDGSGNIYAAGLTDTALDNQTNAGLMDALLVKYNNSGSKLWTRLLGGYSYDRAVGSIGVDSSGNVYIAGWTREALSGQIASGSDDAFIAKYDSSGQPLWIKQWGSSGNDNAFALAIKGSNIYVVGQTNGSIDFQSRQGEYDAFISQYDLSGNRIWSRQFGSSNFDSAKAVAIDSNGNAYVAGEIGGVLDDQTNAGGTDAFVVKYDSAGNRIWTKLYGVAGSDTANGVAVDGASNVYITGKTVGGNVFLAKYPQVETVAVAPTTTVTTATTQTAPTTTTTTTVTTGTDTTPPIVSLSGLSATVSYSGINPFNITSSDNVGVIGIQVKKNGSNFGSEIVATSTASLPSIYEISWDTTNESNGSYVFSAVVRDAAGNVTTVYANTVTLNKTSSTTTSSTATTATDIMPPVISSVSTMDPAANSATIIWLTNEAADSQVEYGLTTSYGNSTTINTTLKTGQSIGLTGLTSGSTYHYRVKSKDAFGNLATSGDYTFITLSDSTIPLPPSGLTLTLGSNRTVSLSWTIRTYTTYQKILRRVAGTTAYTQLVELNAYEYTYSDTSLPFSSTETTYEYAVQECSSAGCSSNATQTIVVPANTVSTTDITPPVISNIQVTNITASSATVTWTTNEASNSIIKYETNYALLFPQRTDVADLVINHSVNLSGLTAGTAYYYYVLSIDASNNHVYSDNRTFTTLAAASTSTATCSNLTFGLSSTFSGPIDNKTTYILGENGYVTYSCPSTVYVCMRIINPSGVVTNIGCHTATSGIDGFGTYSVGNHTARACYGATGTTDCPTIAASLPFTVIAASASSAEQSSLALLLNILFQKLKALQELLGQ